MPAIIHVGDRLIRISPNRRTLEYSGNGGGTWSILTSNSEFNTINDLFYDGYSMYVAANKGFFHSGNSGYAWAMRANAAAYGRFLDIGGDSSKLFATTDNGFYYSMDGGFTWCLLHT